MIRPRLMRLSAWLLPEESRSGSTIIFTHYSTLSPFKRIGDSNMLIRKAMDESCKTVVGVMVLGAEEVGTRQKKKRTISAAMNYITPLQMFHNVRIKSE